MQEQTQTEIPKEIRYILEDRHDNDLEYLQECYNDGESEEDCKGTLKRINIIRNFLGDKKLKWNDLKED